MHFEHSPLLLLILLFPLAGALANGIGHLFSGPTGDEHDHKPSSNKTVSMIAVGSIAFSFALSLYLFGQMLFAHKDGFSMKAWEWMTLVSPTSGEVTLDLAFVFDHLSGLMCVMVTGIATLIHIYSTSYMGDDPGYPRFMTYLNLFSASMLLLILGSSLPVMFIGWEGVGLCSYLLIGFWWTNPDYAAAGKKAFIVNRIGDFGVIGAIALIFLYAGKVDFAGINSVATSLAYTPLMINDVTMPINVATLAVLLLFLGCAGKSAQLPLYVWLPDAMAGPTPVSALIHAATMVTAGVYLSCRLSPLFLSAPNAMAVIALVGTLTALVAASIGLVQNQLKKVLAYSTVSQLGFMFAAVGTGAFAAGFFHVFTHAFFKACLFLGAGSVMHAVHAHGDADVRALGGLKKYMPKTHLTFLLSCLAIAGVPLFSGFFSKDEILAGAFGVARNEYFSSGNFFGPWVGYAVYGGLLIAATMTAFYMFRLYFLTFHGSFKGHNHHDEHHAHVDAHAHGTDAHADSDAHAAHGHQDPHESDAWITTPLLVLAFFAVVAGFLGLPHWLGPNWWGHWLLGDAEHKGVVAAATEAGHHFDIVSAAAMIGGTLAAIIGIGLAYVFYMQKGGQPAAKLVTQFPRIHSFLMGKWYVDEFYNATIVRLMRSVASLSAWVDAFIVDGALAKFTAFVAKKAGAFFRGLQTGSVYAYAAGMAVGLFMVLWWFVYPQPHLQARTVGDTVRWNAGMGLGNMYRFDFDSDGTWDTGWQSDPVGTHAYPQETSSLALILSGPEMNKSPGTQEDMRYFLTGLGQLELPVGELGAWAKSDVASPVKPYVVYDHDGAKLHVNDADLPAMASNPKDTVISLKAGQAFQLGNVSLRVVRLVKAKVEAKNALGNTKISEADVVLGQPTSGGLASHGLGTQKEHHE